MTAIISDSTFPSTQNEINDCNAATTQAHSLLQSSGQSKIKKNKKAIVTSVNKVTKEKTTPSFPFFNQLIECLSTPNGVDQVSFDTEDEFSSLFQKYMKLEPAIRAIVASFVSTVKNQFSAPSNIPFYQGILTLIFTEQIPVSIMIRIFASFANALQPARRIYFFLSFLGNKSMIIEQTLRDIYDDENFLQTTLLQTLTGRVRSLSLFLNKLQTYLHQGAMASKLSTNKKAPTQPHPPKLTKLQPPSMPVVVSIPTLPKPKPVPSFLSPSPPPRIPPSTYSTQKPKPSKPESLQPLPSSSTSPLPTLTHRPSPPPLPTSIPPLPTSLRSKAGPSSSSSSSSSTSKHLLLAKPTTTSLLREHALLQKKELQEKQHFERALHSLLDFEAYQDQLEKDQQKQLYEQQVHLVQTKFKVQLIHEEAQIAREVKVKEKSEEAQYLKVQKQQWQLMLEAYEKELEQKHHDLIKRVRLSQERAHQQKVKVMEHNHELVQTLQTQFKLQQEQWKQEWQKELEEKKERIQQLKALESLPSNSGSSSSSSHLLSTLLDSTETSQCGLLTEMSFAEWALRWEQQKRENEEQMELKKQAILVTKQEKRAHLETTKQKLIQSHHQSSMKLLKSEISSLSSSSSSSSCLDRVEKAKFNLNTVMSLDSNLHEMQQKLAQRRLAKQHLIQSNHASPHKYRIKIRVKEQPTKVVPPPSISTSLPHLPTHQRWWGTKVPYSLRLTTIHSQPTLTSSSSSSSSSSSCLVSSSTTNTLREEVPKISHESSPLSTLHPSSSSTTETHPRETHETSFGLRKALKEVLGVDKVV